MSYPGFEDAMRRVITGDGPDAQSLIILDGPPANVANAVNPASLFEIWHDAANGPLDPKQTQDRGETIPMLCPSPGQVKVRWFVVNPLPEGVTPEQIKPLAREAFKAIGAEACIADQDKHAAMHRTHSLDIIAVLSGDVSLVLDTSETRLKPGNIVIQRGTAHAWRAHGGPALMLAVLIDRDLA
ncbi:Bll6423 protein [alpha proteobacterium U9-1i]|nr:Bll6423 protein [alpha proteobacterium U9-1i]